MQILVKVLSMHNTFGRCITQLNTTLVFMFEMLLMIIIYIIQGACDAFKTLKINLTS